MVRQPAKNKGWKLKAGRICVVPGCEKPVCRRNWCRAHVERIYKHGDPMIKRKDPPLKERLMAKVVLEKDTDCWIWRGETQNFL
jgi:hypothetical protein